MLVFDVGSFELEEALAGSQTLRLGDVTGEVQSFKCMLKKAAAHGKLLGKTETAAAQSDKCKSHQRPAGVMHGRGCAKGGDPVFHRLVREGHLRLVRGCSSSACGCDDDTGLVPTGSAP